MLCHWKPKLAGFYWEGEGGKAIHKYTLHTSLLQLSEFHITSPYVFVAQIATSLFVEIPLTCQELKTFWLCFSGFLLFQIFWGLASICSCFQPSFSNHQDSAVFGDSDLAAGTSRKRPAIVGYVINPRDLALLKGTCIADSLFKSERGEMFAQLYTTTQQYTSNYCSTE